MGRLPFYASCVNWPDEHLHILDHLIESSEPLDRSQFAVRVEETAMLPPDWDYAVSYWELPGRAEVVWYRHSAIEHVYADESTIETLSATIASPPA
jgi:hypothetical protein